MSLSLVRKAGHEYRSEKPDYGIDAPGVIRNLIVSGIAVLLLGWFVPSLTIGPVTLILGRMSIWPGISLILAGVLDDCVCRGGEVSTPRPHAEDGGLAGR